MDPQPDADPHDRSSRDAAVAAFRACTPEERLEALGEMTTLLAIVQAQICTLTSVCADEGDHDLDGAGDMTSWLVGAAGWSRRTAAEIARAATALDDLPTLAGRFGSGALSWDQIRPATRFATPETDPHLAEDLPGRTAAHIEALARRLRPRTDDDDRDAHVRRGLGWRADHRRGGVRYHGFLPTEMAAEVNAVLTGLAEAAGPGDDGIWEPFAARCADALHHLATGDADAPEVEVVVHVDAEVVAGLCAGNGEIDDQVMSRSSVLRHLCDGKVGYSIDGPDGTCVGIGRASRAVPRWLRRRIEHRDGRCRWPGCDRRIRQVHHLRHWVRDEGPTDSWNLMGVCWAHHDLLHAGGWEATGSADGHITLTGPHGRTLTSGPRPPNPATAHAARRLGLTIPEPPRTPTVQTASATGPPSGTTDLADDAGRPRHARHDPGRPATPTDRTRPRHPGGP